MRDGATESDLAGLRQWLPSGRRLLLPVGLGVATVIGLLAWSGWQGLAVSLGGTDWRLLGLAAIIHYSGFGVRGLRWRRLLSGMGHHLSYGTVTSLLIGGWFLSALVPARAGDLLRVGILHLGPRNEPAVPLADGLSSLVLERVLDITAILLLGGGFLSSLVAGSLPGWVLAVYTTALGLVVAFAVLVSVSPPIIGRLRGLSHRSLWRVAMAFLDRLVSSLGLLWRRPRDVALLLAESVYIWLCDALLLWLVLASLGHSLSFAPVAFAALTVDVVAAVPVTPGGVGQIDLAYGALLALVALPTSLIPVAILLTRGISYWSFLPISALITITAGYIQFHPTKPTHPITQ